MTEETSNEDKGMERSSVTHHQDRRKKIPFYAPIEQRHRWDEPQELPPVQWADLFYDLFFVGMAYNLGQLVLGAWASPISIIYAIGLYFPCANVWHSKVFFDARYKTGEDLYHRSLLVIELSLLTTAVLHINELERMRNPVKYYDTFIFSLSITSNLIFNTLRKFEVYCNSKSRTEAKKDVWRDFIFSLLPFFCYVAATLLSGLLHLGNNDHDQSLDQHRFLKEETTSHAQKFFVVGDIPLYLFLCGTLTQQGLSFLKSPRKTQRQESSTPANTEFVIHRSGEWIMLMLGETILSLLIVHIPIETKEYYFTLFCSLVTIIFMQFLHFHSEPHHPEDHAIRRSRKAGTCYIILTRYYSAAVVALGFSYKMMVSLFAVQLNTDETSTLHTSSTSHSQENSNHMRYLAGTPSTVTIEEKNVIQTRVAIFFCLSMLFAIVILDMMALAHKGGKGKTCRSRAMASLKLISIGTLLGCAILITNKPEHIASLGLVVVIINVGYQVILEEIEDEQTLKNDGEEA